MSIKILIDSSLVVPWSLDLIQDEPFDYPFKADYRLGNKKLVYIAALHSCELNSATFRVIRESIENEKIELMILEGFQYSLSKSPREMVNWAVKQDLKGLYDGFETAYAISLAEKKNIPFVGCEPDDSVICSEILKYGYTTEDLLFYYFVQQIFQMNEAHSKVPAQTLFDDLVKSKTRILELTTNPNYKDFQEWYLRGNGQQFVPSTIDESVPAPYKNGDLITQRISSLVYKIRDQFILTKVEAALNNHDSVLIVCGGSHWSTQKFSLEKTFGKPSFSRPN